MAALSVANAARAGPLRMRRVTRDHLDRVVGVARRDAPLDRIDQLMVVDETALRRGGRWAVAVAAAAADPDRLRAVRLLADAAQLVLLRERDDLRVAQVDARARERDLADK